MTWRPPDATDLTVLLAVLVAAVGIVATVGLCAMLCPYR